MRTACIYDKQNLFSGCLMYRPSALIWTGMELAWRQHSNLLRQRGVFGFYLPECSQAKHDQDADRGCQLVPTCSPGMPCCAASLNWAASCLLALNAPHKKPDDSSTPTEGALSKKASSRPSAHNAQRIINCRDIFRQLADRNPVYSGSSKFTHSFQANPA